MMLENAVFLSHFLISEMSPRSLKTLSILKTAWDLLAYLDRGSFLACVQSLSCTRGRGSRMLLAAGPEDRWHCGTAGATGSFVLGHWVVCALEHCAPSFPWASTVVSQQPGEAGKGASWGLRLKEVGAGLDGRTLYCCQLKSQPRPYCLSWSWSWIICSNFLCHVFPM